MRAISLFSVLLLVLTGTVYATETPGRDEEETLIFMREEEKLARDVYLAFDRLWNHRVFRNIVRSEEQHMRILGREIFRSEISDSVINYNPGVFTDDTLQKLYDELVQRGSGSMQDSFVVAAYVEELDIRDLKDAIANTDRAELIAAYNSLLQGSYRHLQAFVRQIQRGGVEYEAQLLPPEEVAAILGRGMHGGH